MKSGMCRAAARIWVLVCLAAFPAKADPGPADESGVSWAYGWMVDSVTVSGNTHTRGYVVLREMETQPGDALDRDTIRRDIRFLNDMTPFSAAEVTADSLFPGHCALRVHVRERSEILVKAILPQFKYDFERGLTYGIRWNNKNFGGRLERLVVEYSRNEMNDDLASLSWWAPWLGWSHVSLGAGVSYYNRGDVPYEISPLEQLNLYGFVGLPLTRSRITFSQVYARLDLDKSRVGGYEPHEKSDLEDHKQLSISPLLGFRYDGRDSPLRPTRGGTAGVSLRATYPFDDGEAPYYLISQDSRYFLGIGEKHVLAVLSNFDYQLGSYPEYSYLYLGGSGSLRGHDLRRFRGYHRWFQTAEWRYLLLPQRVFPVPVVKEFDLSLGLVTFVDTGIVWGREEEFALSGFHGTTGLGLRIYSPVQDVFRVDFGFDLHGNHRFHTATGIRF